MSYDLNGFPTNIYYSQPNFLPPFNPQAGYFRSNPNLFPPQPVISTSRVPLTYPQARQAPEQSTVAQNSQAPTYVFHGVFQQLPFQPGAIPSNQVQPTPLVASVASQVNTAAQSVIKHKFTEHKPEKSSRKRKAGKVQNQCGDCKTFETPEWRRGKDGVRLCNACGIAWAKAHPKDAKASNAKEKSNHMLKALPTPKPKRARKVAKLQQTEIAAPAPALAPARVESSAANQTTVVANNTKSMMSIAKLLNPLNISCVLNPT